MPVELTRDRAPDSPLYAPYASGTFRMEPGLFPFGKDCGNGPNDGRLFQIDGLWPEYRAAKRRARGENLGKYFLTRDFDDGTQAAVTRFIVGRLLDEHPERFRREERGVGFALFCVLSGEELLFDENARLVGGAGYDAAGTPYVSGFDALMTQLQEDAAVVSASNGGEFLSAIHLCFPNHWDPAGKIGKDFAGVHAPVADNALINSSGPKVLKALSQNGQGFARFAWGLSTDLRLNHHPSPPPGTATDSWTGRSFDPSKPRLFVRVERQTLRGLPEAKACFFAIRTYFGDCAALSKTDRLSVAAAVESMSSNVKAYKGLSESYGAIAAWLRKG